MIGQLQEKNVKYIASFVKLIHSVDSLKLLQKIDREALKNERMIDCLLEFHIAEEETKSGLDWEEACRLLESDEFKVLEHIRIVGSWGSQPIPKTMNRSERNSGNFTGYSGC